MEDDLILNEETSPELNVNKPESVNPDPGKNDIVQTWNSLLIKLQANKELLRIIRITSITVITFISILFTLSVFIYIVPAIQEIIPVQQTKIMKDNELLKDPAYIKEIGQMAKDIQRLSRKNNAYTSGQSYVVINTTDNTFQLFRNKKLVREGSCSTGSYKKLLTAEGKSWTFKTPRGKFSIQNKRTNPYWHKPDWAFIEEGVPIPPKESPLRWESGVLGDYAMDLGDSYMIHGTIYKRFLGMAVTHGCVRMNDEDLEVVFNTLNIGSKVYIF